MKGGDDRETALARSSDKSNQEPEREGKACALRTRYLAIAEGESLAGQTEKPDVACRLRRAKIRLIARAAEEK